MSTPTIKRSASGSQLASGGPVWSWTFPGAPICINLTRSLVVRLQSDVDARTRAQGEAGRELGGILFGHQRGKESIVDIDDYVWLASEPTQNGTYSLNTAELERLRGEHAAGASTVIGYFRTDFGATLELRDAEIDLVGKQFSDSTNVVLLICSSRPHTGGFFFWMGEGVMSPFSLMDFPLDATRLPFHEDADASQTQRLDVPISELPAAAPPPVPESEAVKWPVLDPALRKVAAPATIVQMPSKAAPAPPPPVISIAQPQAEQAPLPQSPEAAGRVHENAIRTSPMRDAGSTNAAPSRAKGVFVGIAWTLALLIGGCLAAGVIVIAFRGGPPPFATTARTGGSKPQPSAAPFQLDVEAQGTGLNIRWDARGPAVTDAREGKLTLSEANKPAVVIPLTAEQLTIGHIYFQSSAERLEVQLETAGNAGNISRESVLALSYLPRTASEAATAGTSKIQQPNSQQRYAAPVAPSQSASVPVRKVETIPLPAKDERPTTRLSASEQSRSIARTFTPPSASQTPLRMPVIDQPVAPTPQQSSSVPVPISNGVLSTRLAPPPPPVPAAGATAPLPAPVQTASQQVKVTNSLQEAKLLKKVAPVYPSVALAGRIQGVVKLTATIAKDGTIGNLQFMGGPSVFAKPAMDAVKQWTYQPTILNGQPVEVVTEIDVNFTLSR